MKEAKKLNYADKIKKALNKNKTIWSIVNLESNKTGNMDKINTLNTNGTPISDCQKMANEFNKYFSSVAKIINSKQNKLSPYNVDNTTPLYNLTQSFKNPFPNIYLKYVTTKEIKNIIKSLNLKNSSGYDGISTKLLKISSPFFTSPLTHICNKSISSGTFPDRLKYAVVKPLL
jgi:hypothetical protein